MKIFRIFISSTFSDLQAERDWLQKEVFPRLRSLCFARGARFQAVDLRWGVSREAGLNQRTMRICLDEIRRCQKATPRPNFLVLLGGRYGWRPLPEQVSAAYFNEIRRCAATSHGLLQQWYRCDHNAVPPQFVLQPRDGDYGRGARWREEESTLRQTLEDAARELDLPPEARLLFGVSATEHEIILGTIPPGESGRAFAFLRTIRGLVSDQQAERFFDLKEGRLDTEARTRLELLKERLREGLPGSVHEYVANWTPSSITLDHLARLGADVYESLSRVILEELDDWTRQDELTHEIAAHVGFGWRRTRQFVGREKVLEQLASYIVSSSRSAFAVVGSGGVGKSTLMAKAAQEERSRHQDAIVIERYIGATPESSDTRLLLRGLCRELARAYGASEAEISTSYNELVPAFRRGLERAWAGKPLVVFIDALDQLAGPNRATLRWMPIELPPFVRLIVSALPELHPVLARTISAENLMELAPMTRQEGGTLLDLWLMAAKRTLQPVQRKHVLRHFEGCPFPLYLRLVFERARQWRSYEALPALGTDMATVISGLLAELSDEANHGQVLVRRSLALMAAARNGLAEDELLDLLGEDSEVMDEFRRRSPDSPPVEALPPIIWSRLHSDLAPYLTSRTADGAVLLTFFHRQFREEVSRALLLGEARRDRHAQLAHYFANCPLHFDGAARQQPNLRRLSELPYQQTAGELWCEAAATLLEFTFLETKIHTVGPVPLIEDFERLLAALKSTGVNSDALRAVLDAVRLSAHLFEREPHQLATQLAGRLGASKDAAIQDLLAQARPTQAKNWLRPLTQSLWAADSPVVRTYAGHAAVIWKVAVSRDGAYAVSGGNDNTIILWDIKSGVELYRLSNLPGPVLALAISHDDRFFVCSAGSVLLMCDLVRGIRLRECDPEKKDWIRALAITPDGRRVVFANDIEGPFVWDLETGEVRPAVERPRKEIHAIALLDEGRKAICGTCSWNLDRSEDGIIVWDLASGAELASWCTGGVRDIAVTTDEACAITAGSSGALQVWELPGGRLLKSFVSHAQWIDAVALAPDGNFLVSASADRQIKVWDMATATERATLGQHHGTARCLAMLRDGRRFLSGSDDQKVLLWELDRIGRPMARRAHAGAVHSLVLTPEFCHVLSASDDGMVKLWKVATGDLVRAYPCDGPIFCAAVTPDGKYILAFVNGNTLALWDLESGEKSHELHLCPPHPNHNSSIVVTADGKHFFHSGTLFDFWTGAELYSLPQDSGGVLAILPGGKQAITGRAQLWDLENNTALYDFGRGMGSVSVVPGDRLVTASHDGVAIWDLRERRLLTELHGHRGSVAGVAATLDGRWAASASGDYDLIIWDLEAGMETTRFSAEAPLLSCALTPDGRFAIAGDQLGNVHFLAIEQGVDQLQNLPSSV